jgi:extracellular factor (EF) 3-hydroxypalmitic acid methyl ester biosynthesis protein
MTGITSSGGSARKAQQAQHDEVDGGAVLAAAARLADSVAELDRALRRRGITIPPLDCKQELARDFWDFVTLLDRCEAQGFAEDSLRRATREVLGKWLFRSRYWSRAYHKPHGYAGDFRMIEWLYDLESDPCADPTQPALVNCLDYLMSTVHSTRMLWERRRWFAAALSREHVRQRGKLRVLDVAAGGARYIRDFLEQLEDASGVEVTLVDQDAAAIVFCREQSLEPWSARLTTLCTRITDCGTRLSSGAFDIIICAGVLDYLSDEACAALLLGFSRLLAPQGLLAFSNYHPSDPSRSVKSWLVDWSLRFRSESACAELLPQQLEVRVQGSSDGTLIFATGRREA